MKENPRFWGFFFANRADYQPESTIINYNFIFILKIVKFAVRTLNIKEMKLNKYFKSFDLVAFFRTDRNIRRKAFEFEELLKKENSQFKFNILPFDETEDPSIPRMLAQYNRDKLEISQQRISYQSIFKLDTFNDNEIFKMARKRERVVSLIVSELEYLYSGFILKYFIKFESDDEVWSFLRDKLGSKPLAKKLVNFSFLYAFSRADQNFININISAIMKSELSEHSGIEISIDVNDKLKTRNSLENSQGLGDNINIVEEIIKNYTLENLVTGDIYE